VRRGLRRRLEEAFLRSLDGAERMVRDRLQLEPERHHIGEEPGLDDLVEVDPVGGEVRAALLEEADDGPQRLQVARYAQVVECDPHGGPSPRAVSSARAGTTRAVGDGAGATTIRVPSPCTAHPAPLPAPACLRRPTTKKPSCLPVPADG